MDAATALTPLIRRLFHGAPPVRFEFWDGSAMGPSATAATIRVRSPRALRRLATAPGELGMARAYVAGDVDLEGDLEAILALSDLVPDLGMGPAALWTVLRAGPRRARSSPDGSRPRPRRSACAGDSIRRPATRPPSLTTTTCPTISTVSSLGRP